MCAAYGIRQSKGVTSMRSGLCVGRDVPEHAVTRGCHGSAAGTARDRSSTGAGVFRGAPAGPIRTHRRSTGAALQRRLLAHYTQVSTQPDVDVPAPATLSAVFDHFVADTTLLHDRLMMETAGAQCLLLAGFFEDQMRPRHNIRWYAELGASFFSRAALQERSLHKARLLDGIARRFEPWRRRHAELSRELRDQPYLLTPPMPPTPSSG
jgi:hypothetical protein